MVTARMGEWKSLSGYVRLASLSLGSVSVPFVTSSFTSSERHEPVPPGRRKERRVTWETWGTVRGRSLSSFTLVRHSPFSTRVAPFSPRFGPSPQARVLLSEWDGAVREGNGEGKDTAGGVGSSRLLTRSLHSSYVMWEGREEPA